MKQSKIYSVLKSLALLIVFSSVSQSIFGQCDQLVADFNFAFIDEETVLLINASDQADSIQWELEGATVTDDFHQTLIASYFQDTLKVCITAFLLDGCAKTVCKDIYVGHAAELCMNTDCIWPGDANGDGAANNYDLLNIGIGYGSLGIARTLFPVPHDPIFWAPSHGEDWNQHIGPVNYKHLDANGDGHINKYDISAIYKNYTPKTEFTTPSNNNEVPIRLELNPFIEMVDSEARTVFTLNVFVGNRSNEVIDLHGMALRLSFLDTELLDEVSYIPATDNNLLGGQTISLSQEV
ncbi:MAG: hypothetical protein AAFO07_29965, partial [Bacteroidota bacterium]